MVEPASDVPVISTDEVLVWFDKLSSYIEPAITSFVKYDYQFIDCIKFDFDPSLFYRSQKLRLHRACWKLQLCVEQLNNLLEFINLKFR